MEGGGAILPIAPCSRFLLTTMSAGFTTGAAAGTGGASGDKMVAASLLAASRRAENTI